MVDVPGSPWWVVLAAAVPSAASGIWVAWRWWMERGDRRIEASSTLTERFALQLEAQRTALSKDQAELFDRIRAELARTQVRLAEVEHDRDRAWDLARWWNRRAHELRHAGLNAQTMVAGFCARDEVETPVWPDMTVPGLEDPR